jgi:alkanesulfonate monooxygenase SsuD/methylene tetrahydromethanopterin reductase-like flavin-dependent oxidoreductase (luciferase family)
MEIGYFTMPSHPPECGLKEGHDWDLEVLRWLDELGYQECWIGEHHTAPWEPHPSGTSVHADASWMMSAATRRHPAPTPRSMTCAGGGSA